MLEIKKVKNKTITSKINEEQLQKLENLALKKGLTKSNLISQLIEIGYKEITKNKTF